MAALVLAVQFCAAVQREAEEIARFQARAAPATVYGRFELLIQTRLLKREATECGESLNKLSGSPDSTCSETPLHLGRL